MCSLSPAQGPLGSCPASSVYLHPWMASYSLADRIRAKQRPESAKTAMAKKTLFKLSLKPKSFEGKRWWWWTIFNFGWAVSFFSFSFWQRPALITRSVPLSCIQRKQSSSRPSKPVMERWKHTTSCTFLSNPSLQKDSVVVQSNAPLIKQQLSSYFSVSVDR